MENSLVSLRSRFWAILAALLDWTANFKKRWGFARWILSHFPQWITPNSVTWSRLPMLVPTVYDISVGDFSLAFWWTVVSTVCDFIDGGLAHVRGLESSVGAFLDPLVDKIVTGVTLGFLVPRLPWMFLPIIIVLNILAVLLTAVRVKRGLGSPVSKNTFASKTAGKLKAVFEDVSLLLILAGLSFDIPWALQTIPWALLTLSLPLAAWSLYHQRHP